MTWTTAQEQALKVAVGQRISWPKVAASVNQEHGTEFSVVACQLKWARLNQKVSKKVSNITALQQCYSNTTERGLRAQGKSSTSGLQRQSTTLQFRNMKVHHMHEAVPCPEGTAQPGPLDGLGFVRKIVSQCDTALLNVDVNVIILPECPPMLTDSDENTQPWPPQTAELDRLLADYTGSAQFKHHGADRETEDKSADELYASVRKILTGPTERTFLYAKYLLEQQAEARRSDPNAIIEIELTIQTGIVDNRSLYESRAIGHSQRSGRGKLNSATRTGADKSKATLYGISITDDNGRRFLDSLDMKVLIDITNLPYDGNVRTELKERPRSSTEVAEGVAQQVCSLRELLEQNRARIKTEPGLPAAGPKAPAESNGKSKKKRKTAV